ncbi:hypothetical protein BC938DRAFT_480187 [Jimgerdemannia flammicorona]|uniref:VWFA domain-containing protein n=1 Tax=Jimgerdemannia flammicorona TaxID=994334 RepID=A0A433QJ42_9FUNG|nr:hypothetical protein BC938DRAFT_480187 [Jimgerdemannia flammicorona]
MPSSDLVPLTDFEILTVHDPKVSIQKFIKEQELTFKKGAGFYQLTKPEHIQLNKKVYVQKISDPDTLITGDSVRAVLGLGDSKGGAHKYMVDPDVLDEFRIFVQSTSYNRNLIGGTMFLYEKEGAAKAADAAAATANSSKKRPMDAPDFAGPSKQARTSTAPGTSIVHAPPAATGGANEEIEIVFSFDTTVSMYPCLSTVRGLLKDTLKRLTGLYAIFLFEPANASHLASSYLPHFTFSDQIPNIRIGIIAHGDYYAESTTYLIKASNDYRFCTSASIDKLCDFVSNVAPTCGGDWAECYELALHHAATRFDWSPTANKSLVVIGDAVPHEPGQVPFMPTGKQAKPTTIDWRVEAANLKKKGVRVYAVQCLDQRRSDAFYRDLALATSGFHLHLHQFSSIADFLVAICYKEFSASTGDTTHLVGFETEVRSAGRMFRNLCDLFNRLLDKPESKTNPTSKGLEAVSPSRFQVLTVDKDMPIKQFVMQRGLVFKTGKGFYEFTKPETVSNKKEIVLMDKKTGDFYTGWNVARKLAGVVPGMTQKQKPKGLDDYRVFVQSTSYNRKLIGGTGFLFEVDENL